jgi:hypothetical protein
MSRIFMIALLMILFSCNKEHSCCKVEPTDSVTYQNVEASSKQEARESCQEIGTGWSLTEDANCIGG